jgi:hypothetical protein
MSTQEENTIPWKKWYSLMISVLILIIIFLTIITSIYN